MLWMSQNMFLRNNKECVNNCQLTVTDNIPLAFPRPKNNQIKHHLPTVYVYFWIIPSKFMSNITVWFCRTTFCSILVYRRTPIIRRCLSESARSLGKICREFCTTNLLWNYWLSAEVSIFLWFLELQIGRDRKF